MYEYRVCWIHPNVYYGDQDEHFDYMIHEDRDSAEADAIAWAETWPESIVWIDQRVVSEWESI